MFNTRSINCKKHNIPEGLIGPSSTVSVQVEGIYTKAILDTGSQVTILYRSFYDKYLRHLSLTPLHSLQIWGLSPEDYPYDGYLSLRLEFAEADVGVAETLEALVLVCPDPQVRGEAAMLIGSNTAVVRRLLTSCRARGGENFLRACHIHPSFERAFEGLPENSQEGEDGKRGTVWYGQARPCVLRPGGVANVLGVPKFPGTPSMEAILIESPDDPGEEPRFPSEIMVRPELQTPTVAMARRVTVTVRNMSSRDITLRRGMPIAYMFPVNILPPPATEGDPVKREKGLTSSSFQFGESSVPQEWKDRLIGRMMEKGDVFSTHEFDVGCSRSTQHSIRTTEDTPFRERSRRLAPADIEGVRQHLAKLKEAGIISESRSPYASPIVVVRKKNGRIRMCVDFRTLNRRTVPDQYTVPKIEDALACLSGSKWFSVLDLRSGYYQIPMTETDKEKTAFICPVGFYQFERMPQGVSGAPATFQRIMEQTVGDMNLLEVLVYLDDIIVFGATLEQHEARLMKVLDRLQEEGLKLSLDKCHFCQTSVTYVGHIISEDGVATDPSKIEAVTTWPRPDTVTALRSFLGFCGYYRRFVRDYSKVAHPLNQLLAGYLPAVEKKKKGRGIGRKDYFKQSEPFGVRWDERCEEAFCTLKRSLTQAPVLAFADPRLPYTLHVDASLEGLGGVLYQDQGEGLRPVAFVSRSLSPSERNYPVHKLEFLALKWAVVDKLQDYLYGAKFEVRTDNNPLTYVLTSAKLDATGHRWLAALSVYDFSLKYRPGNQNVDADALSRRPHLQLAEWGEVNTADVKVLCQLSMKTEPKDIRPSREVDQLGALMQAVPEAFCNLASLNVQHLPMVCASDMSKAQQEDPGIQTVFLAVRRGDPTQINKSRHPDCRLFQREWNKLEIRDGVLYRVTHPPQQPRHLQMVLPKRYRKMVLRSLHDDAGHLGVDKTYGLVRDRFYWPHMLPEVEEFCRTCTRCIQRKTLPRKAAPLVHMQSDGPLDLVCMDFLSIEADSSNTENVLVITDHYTRYAQAFPTKDQTAATVAKVLWEKYFVHYGLPKRMHSDQGRDFESRLIHELLSLLGVQKSRTTPYHPQGDPQPERFNRTLLDMLGTLDSKGKSKWSHHIGHLVHSYNCTKNEATGFSPYYLMFGREARMPVDVCFGVSSDGTSHKNYLKYVSDMRRDLRAAYDLAEIMSAKQNRGNKQRYDRKVKFSRLMPGDRVLIQNLGLPGKHKLADRWASTPYIVVSQMSHLPVFQLKPADGHGPVKTLHRNHLLPIRQQVCLGTPDEGHLRTVMDRSEGDKSDRSPEDGCSDQVRLWQEYGDGEEVSEEAQGANSGPDVPGEVAEATQMGAGTRQSQRNIKVPNRLAYDALGVPDKFTISVAQYVSPSYETMW